MCIVKFLFMIFTIVYNVYSSYMVYDFIILSVEEVVLIVIFLVVNEEKGRKKSVIFSMVLLEI